AHRTLPPFRRAADACELVRAIFAQCACDKVLARPQGVDPMRETRTARGAELRTSNEIASVLPWLHQQALRGATGGTVLKALCERLVAGGLDIQRAVVGSL